MHVTAATSGDVTIFRIKGRLDSTTSSQFQSKVLPAIEQGVSRIVLDFQDVDFVSSAGLRIVLLIAKGARAVQGKLAVFGLNEAVREIFEVSGFSSILNIVGSEAEATACATA